ncbi:carboxylesterase family protein [Stakelama sp. CBK3Z-3]|uniref:Carboxylic ester hydrolase n=1 Tax=Stakelama flava TaxID=2860338 RepID=A0ABS6XKM5_9SPHN|nr:carboxylesterase family protein [Stakelama flava]MBW4330484.1 carboxylesterase family protein [Stakelama flava]
MADCAPPDPALCDVTLRDDGTVRGLDSGAIRSFIGIPYAQPPIGSRRFALPQPPEPTFVDATDHVVCAPQRISKVPGLDVIPLIGDGQSRDGDYLSLNIWTPGDAAGRPVMVFIHGGGFVLGGKDAAVSDGSSFARSGVVCVAINYRLGVEGFLPIPDVPTNLGLRDIIAALAWVRDNIAAFGGDPSNVTIFGESAGAMAIADLVTSPLAKGLFRRAIIESGHGAMVRDIPVAERLVKKLARILKIAPDRAGFEQTDTKACLDATERVSKPTAHIDLRDAAGHEPVFGISRFVPVFGDDVLPSKPLDALRRGAGSDIDILIGTNAEEMNLYFVPTGVKRKIGRLLARYALGKSHPHAGKVLKAYGMGRRGTRPGEAMTAAMSDLVFRWPARQYAAAHEGRTWMYEFDWRSPAFDGELGAAHAMELPFVFDTLATATGKQGLVGEDPPQALADRMHRIWVNFATDSSLPWQQFDAATRQVYQISSGKTVHEPVMPAADFLPH